MNIENYLNMQRKWYENETKKWSLKNKNPVVGSYHKHNAFSDYEKYLFKDFETKGLIALEYGCGPGRNIIRFQDRFQRIDGVDISERNLINAEMNLHESNVELPNLMVCDGKSIPVKQNTYDVIFSVICLQHICSYDVRYAIMQDIYRCLKPQGKFCFQMGFGDAYTKRYKTYAKYHENQFAAVSTNGGHDVLVEDEKDLIDDLVHKIGYKNYKSDIGVTGPGDSHSNWIWVQVEK